MERAYVLACIASEGAGERITRNQRTTGDLVRERRLTFAVDLGLGISRDVVDEEARPNEKNDLE